MSRLCLTLCRSTLEENLGDIKRNNPDLAELRIDLLDDLSSGALDGLTSFPGRTDLPLILTCRKKADGGAWTGSDSDREDLLLKLMDGEWAFIDLEEEELSKALVDKARERGIRIIRSFHDFEQVPGNLDERLERLRRRGDLVKAAVMPRGTGDLLTLFKTGRAWRERHPGEDGLILLGMGAFGVPSRILASLMGSYLTFCSPGGAETAPGHMSCDILHDLYRVPRLDPESEIFGIIGNPVLHTRSPHIHNPGLKALGKNAVYVPFTVDDVDSFFKLAEFLNIRGFSVTVPHKEAVLPYLQKVDPAVKAVGACNTVVRKGDHWEGFNTDVIGFIEPLKRKCGDLEGKRAAVIGAGGAARSAVYALMNEGCGVFIFNRTESRAVLLAQEFKCSGGSLESLKERHKRGEQFDLIIQTTSAGMHGDSEGDDPVSFYSFGGSETVYDIIYTPPVTALMERAARSGASVLGGMPMLQEQAKAQFRLFTGRELQ